MAHDRLIPKSISCIFMPRAICSWMDCWSPMAYPTIIQKFEAQINLRNETMCHNPSKYWPRISPGITWHDIGIWTKQKKYKLIIWIWPMNRSLRGRRNDHLISLTAADVLRFSVGISSCIWTPFWTHKDRHRAPYWTRWVRVDFAIPPAIPYRLSSNTYFWSGVSL